MKKIFITYLLFSLPLCAAVPADTSPVVPQKKVSPKKEQKVEPRFVRLKKKVYQNRWRLFGLMSAAVATIGAFFVGKSMKGASEQPSESGTKKVEDTRAKSKRQKTEPPPLPKKDPVVLQKVDLADQTVRRIKEFKVFLQSGANASSLSLPPEVANKVEELLADSGSASVLQALEKIEALDLFSFSSEQLQEMYEQITAIFNAYQKASVQPEATFDAHVLTDTVKRMQARTFESDKPTGADMERMLEAVSLLQQWVEKIETDVAPISLDDFHEHDQRIAQDILAASGAATLSEALAGISNESFGGLTAFELDKKRIAYLSLAHGLKQRFKSYMRYREIKKQEKKDNKRYEAIDAVVAHEAYRLYNRIGSLVDVLLTTDAEKEALEFLVVNFPNKLYAIYDHDYKTVKKVERCLDVLLAKLRQYDIDFENIMEAQRLKDDRERRKKDD